MWKIFQAFVNFIFKVYVGFKHNVDKNGIFNVPEFVFMFKTCRTS